MPRDVVAHWLEICWSTGGLEIPGSNPASSTMILGHCVTRYRPIHYNTHIYSPNLQPI